MMPAEYLLDTNAYFNLLREIQDLNMGGICKCADSVAALKASKPYISTVTKVEIISVIGKYARGKSGGVQPCSRRISDAGTRCEHQWYDPPVPRWSPRKVKGWVQLVKETTSGTSTLLTVDLLPFSGHTIERAERIIQNALIHHFASMDAMIAATAEEAIEDGHTLEVVTSDKGLIACLKKTKIPFRDIFRV